MTVRRLAGLAALARGELGTLHGTASIWCWSRACCRPGRGARLAGLPAAGFAGATAGLAATLVLFPLWLWHLPFFLARPEFGLAQFVGFRLGILSAAIWLTFLWERTHSIGLAVVWHAVLNITRGVALALSTGIS